MGLRKTQWEEKEYDSYRQNLEDIQKVLKRSQKKYKTIMILISHNISRQKHIQIWIVDCKCYNKDYNIY